MRAPVELKIHKAMETTIKTRVSLDLDLDLGIHCCIHIIDIVHDLGMKTGACVPVDLVSDMLHTCRCRIRACMAQEEGSNGSDIIQRLQGGGKLPPAEETLCLDPRFWGRISGYIFVAIEKCAKIIF